MLTNKWRNMRIWDKTHGPLSVLSNLTNQSQAALLDAMVAEAMKQLKQQHPELLPLIENQLKQGETQ